MSSPQSGGGPIEDHTQLAGYLAQGAKPPEAWRIGTEHEKFGFLTESRQPLPYEGARSISAILAALTERGWQPLREGAQVIGLRKAGANISLEPGGQFELSGAPLRTLHETSDELGAHLAEVNAIAAPMGVRFLGVGAAPVWTHDQMPVMPKGRYRLMTDYMGRVGTHGTQMMYRTATVQVNLDFASEADMVLKMRVALALQPVATALFSASPFFEGRLNGHRSWRSRIWRSLDAARTGMLPFVFEDGFGFERYADWVLDVPMYFVYRDGGYVNALGQSFRDFLDGRLPALPGERPTLSDWADHLTTVFPEARLKQFIEMRGADAGPRPMLDALPAFWVGLMYDQGALEAAWDLVKGLDAQTREGLRVAASERGLAGEEGGHRLADLAREAVRIAGAGLAARGHRDGSGRDESHFLAPLEDVLVRGQSPADDMIARFNGAWGGNLDRIYDDYAL
ncbi:MAG: glutamate--cysteine ligase [Rubellimicrobium sp.]|nr:glutamate--cysteine ligase [Rubellimicrobium sp.]